MTQTDRHIIDEAIALADLQSDARSGKARRDLISSESKLTLELIATAGQLARDARASTGLGIGAFAKKAGVHLSTLSLIENGQNAQPPTLLTLARLARATGKGLKITFGDG
jgi:DNA-binding XRE family transcriptional regulator